MSCSSAPVMEEEKRVIRTSAGEESKGMRLDQYLAKRFTYHSRSAWQESIRKGEILLNGRKTRSSRILQGEEQIDFNFPEKEEPPVRSDYTILLEHERFILVNKPGDLPVHPSGRYFNHTLLMMLRKKYPELFIVNRLDRETSGTILMARDAKAAGFLCKAMEHREIYKEYVVYVYGKFPEESFTASGYLSADPASSVRKKRRFTYEIPEGKECGSESCSTSFALIRQYDSLAKVRCILHTGRLHQIRATLCSLGYPVVGDKLYGPDETIFSRFSDGKMTEEDKKLLLIDRQALHAKVLQLTSSFDGSLLTFTAPLPEELIALEK